MMEYPEPFLRDTARVAVHLTKEESRNLEGCLSGVNPRGWMLRMATNFVLRPEEYLEPIAERISPGWNEFTNEELAILLCLAAELDSNLTERLREARRPIQRMDPAKYSVGWRGPGWPEVSKSVRREAGNACKNCGTGENLHVHHKVSFRRFNTPSAANQRDNLEVLCASCHGENSHK